MIRFLFVALSVCCILLAQGCVSIATLKTAESSKAGEINLGVGVTGKKNLESQSEAVLYSLEPYVVMGATDTVDVEAKYHLGPIIGAKVTHFQDTTFSYATELNVGFSGFDGINRRPNIVDLYGGVLVSKRFRHVHIATIGPRIIVRNIADQVNQMFWGGFVNLRFKVKPTVHITPEISYLNQDSFLRFHQRKASGLLAFSIGLNHQF